MKQYLVSENMNNGGKKLNMNQGTKEVAYFKCSFRGSGPTLLLTLIVLIYYNRGIKFQV